MLLPHHRLRLHVAQVVGAAAVERFVKLFRETWARIPLDARRDVLTMWRWPYSRLKLARLRWGDELYSQVVILAEIPGTTLGMMDRGHCLYDLAKLNELDDAEILLTIAHELAHVVVLADRDSALAYSTQRKPDYSTNPESWVHDPEERHVRELCHRWGFGLHKCWPIVSGPATVRCARRRRKLQTA